MKLVFISILFAACGVAQQATPLAPNLVFTGGGGFASPNGKFSYASISKLLGAGTYATAAQEYTLINRKVQSCTLAGVTKQQYAFSVVRIGLTGLGGGCQDGAYTAAAQGFADIGFGKISKWGVVFTATKGTTGGFKFTAGPRWQQ